MTEVRFLGQDPPRYPTIEDAVAVGRDLARDGHDRGILAVRTGSRCAVSPPGAPLGSLSAERFVELVDYDPYNDRLLVMGPGEPDPLAALHWLVLRGRDEAGAALLVEVAPDDGVFDAVPEAERGRNHVETALSLLEHLKQGPVVSLAKRWVLAVGRTAQEARENLMAAQGGDDAA